MPKKKNTGFKGWSLFSSRHRDVVQLLKNDGILLDFNNDDNETNLVRSYDTNIMGRFDCRNHKCQTSGWFSRKIAITIRMYRQNSYNARVYHQKCDACNTTCRPLLDGSYAERVAYRLKKWCGIDLTPPAFRRNTVKAPHRSDLCMGCRAGHCVERRND